MTKKGSSNSNNYRLSSRELDDGIVLSIEKAKNHLRASKYLAEKEQYLSYASALFLYALEEYGRSKLLKKARRQGKKIHNVDKNIFRSGSSHKNKIHEGRKDLTSKMIYVEASVRITHNSSEVQRTISLKKDIKVVVGAGLTGEFATSGWTALEEEMRWRTLYLDWNDSQRHWVNEYRIKQYMLQYLIDQLEQCLSKS